MENRANKGSGTSIPNGEIAWKECWKLKIPNVAKLFLWKALHNLLPTRVNLAKKGIVRNTLCPICGLEEETVAHILWTCPSSNDVWGGTDNKTEAVVWRPPPHNMIKLNWEARLNLKEGRVGLGLIGRDSIGTFLAARNFAAVKEWKRFTTALEDWQHADGRNNDVVGGSAKKRPRRLLEATRK
ncbi:uncharacterized protein LOC132165136 [Corylus avellana]|uniref:uncharacterized protein LOC132165136 n=1 Tax=Corylus avellana TaxID=13451 RepID=UPI00286CB6C3|nr:uncharacterized protein LOC132165136 [Corylus avellana]